MNDLRTLGRAMREALEGARETILELIRARGSEAEGSDDEWVADIDAAIAAFDKALEAEEAEPQLVSEFARINEMLDEGQGDDDGPSILPKFAPGMSVVAKVESCLHLLEKRRDVIAAQAGADWRDDPSADERWNAGCDFAMEQLCAVLKVDPQAVNWDAATETLDGDVQAVLHSILTAAAPALPQGDSAGLIAHHLAQLRHAYAHLAAGAVVHQREFADGLISPAIAALEAALSDAPAMEPGPCDCAGRLPSVDGQWLCPDEMLRAAASDESLSDFAFRLLARARPGEVTTSLAEWALKNIPPTP